MYFSKSNAESYRSSSVTLIATWSLWESTNFWSKVASPKVRAPPSSTHKAAGVVAAMLILCSPEVVILVARPRMMFSSLSTSISRLSYSTGTRYPPSASTPSCRTLETWRKLLLIAFSIAFLYSSEARPVFGSSCLPE